MCRLEILIDVDLYRSKLSIKTKSRSYVFNLAIIIEYSSTYSVVREFTHVVDVAEGHVSALRKLSDNCGLKIYNLGTGKPHSVLEMIAGMEKTSGKKVCF